MTKYSINEFIGLLNKRSELITRDSLPPEFNLPCDFAGLGFSVEMDDLRRVLVSLSQNTFHQDMMNDIDNYPIELAEHIRKLVGGCLIRFNEKSGDIEIVEDEVKYYS